MLTLVLQYGRCGIIPAGPDAGESGRINSLHITGSAATQWSPPIQTCFSANNRKGQQ